MIFTNLKNDVRSKAVSLTPIFPKEGDWKKMHYDQLADIINSTLKESEFLQGDRVFDLGNTISAMTLKRFFENKYDDETASDRRFLKSVDKMAIFLGFEDFVHYTRGKVSSTVNAPTDEDHRFFSNYIKEFCKAEFDMYARLPEIMLDKLLGMLFERCPLRARMETGIRNYSKMGVSLVQDGHRSNFEVYNIEILSLDEGDCICEVQEFWNLLFQGRDGVQIPYHQRNTQNYFFKKKQLGMVPLG